LEFLKSGVKYSLLKTFAGSAKNSETSSSVLSAWRGVRMRLTLKMSLAKEKPFSKPWMAPSLRS
jgi:hypothetical protein